MKPVVSAPRELVERKPAHGKPCTRCGVCCIATLCELGQHVFGQKLGPCPALRFDEQKNSACGLALAGPPSLNLAAMLLIGGGTGCDCRINGEPVNEDFNAFLKRWDALNAKGVAEAKKQWGMP